MQLLISRVLLATDFYRCAGLAFDYALAVTSWWKAELHLFHVLEFLPGMNSEYPVNKIYLDELRKQATQYLNDLEKGAVSAGLRTRRAVDCGIPSSALTRWRAN
jgi:nucleotide-binding universal stress UspA family protein